MFMKKFRILSVVLAAFLMLGLFSACNRGSSSKSGGADITTVRIWTNDAHNKDEYVKAVDAFNAGPGAAQGVKIEYTVFGGDYQTVCDVAISADDEPEIYKADPKIAQYINMGKGQPLSNLPDFQAVLDEYAPFQKEGLTMYDGKVYAIPLSQHVFAMAYNKDLLKRIGKTEPPRTWAEYEADSIAISKLEPGKIFGHALPCKFSDYDEIQLMNWVSQSTGHFQFDFTNGKYVFTDLIPFFEMFQRINVGGGTFPGIETLDDDTYRAQFAEGNIAFCFGGSWNVGVLYDQFPAKMDWGIAPQPVQDVNTVYNVPAIPGSLYVVSNQVKGDMLNKVAIVYKFLASKELRMALFTGGKDIPVNPQIAIDAPPSARPQWGEYGQAGANAVLKPTLPDAYFNLEGRNKYQVFTEIVTGVSKPAEALADLEKRYNEGLQKGIANGQVKLADFLDPSIEGKFTYGRR
ncbi:hypothetical protein FACS1894130_06410 [Spirochaetia bacterium]|nr:hypothetical protein FACS1894130_06410 [Spirochaetia bacterium]